MESTASCPGYYSWAEFMGQPRNSWRKDCRVLNEEVNKNNSKNGANTKIIFKYALSFWILDVLKYLVAFIEIKNFPTL